MPLALEMFGCQDHTADLLGSLADVMDAPIIPGISHSQPRSRANLTRLAWHHLLLTGDRSLEEGLSHFTSAQRRPTLPRGGGTGISAGTAEHDLWTLASLEASTRIASLLGWPEAAEMKEQLAIRRTGLPQLLESLQQVLSAAVSRGARDTASLEAICAACTLQLVDASDPQMSSTIDMILRRSQDNGQAPAQASILLEAARACLVAGRRTAFARLLSAAAEQAAPTGTFTLSGAGETGGGAARGGPAGLAAAAFLRALRDSFVFERHEHASDTYDLVFLAGLAPEWFAEGPSCALRNAPVHGGNVLLELHPGPGACTVFCRWEHRWFGVPRHFIVELPPGIEPSECRGWISLRQGVEGGTVLTLPAESFTLTVHTPYVDPPGTQGGVA